MNKVICKVVYDTESSTILGKRVSGVFGDPAGYEECLYQTVEGKFFLYVNGGETSIHKKEDIIRMSKEKAQDWLNQKD